MEGTDGAIREARRLYAGGSGALLLRRPVQQRRQLAGALRHDRAGDPRADRRPHHALRRRPRHQRHVHRRRPAAARVPPRHPADLGPARFAAARRRRAEAHGDGDQAGHLRSRRSPTRTSGSRPSGPTTLTRRLATEEGLLVGVSSGAALAACARPRRAHPRGRHRHGVSRQRHALPDRAILGRAGRDERGRRDGHQDHGRALEAIRRARRRDLSRRVLRRADRRRRRHRRGLPAAEHDRPAARRGASGSARTTTGRPRRARASAAARSPASIIRIPNHPARPSAYDLEQAWPNLSYVIISVPRPARRATSRRWHLRDDRSGVRTKES